MSAKHEQVPTISDLSEPTPLNYAALQAGMPALQSRRKLGFQSRLR